MRLMLLAYGPAVVPCLSFVHVSRRSVGLVRVAHGVCEGAVGMFVEAA